MSIMKKVEIHHSQVYDFIASLVRLNNNEKFTSRISEINTNDKIKYNEDIQDWVKRTKKMITQDIQEKLDIFFNDETFYGLCLVFRSALNDIKTVDEFIGYLQDLSHVDILMEFLGTGYGLEDTKITRPLVVNLLQDEKNAVLFINENYTIPSRQKWELLQFFLNPDKMKEDLLSLLNWYNETIYKYEMQTAEEAIRKYEKDLQDKLNRYGEDYLKLLLVTDYSKSKSCSRIILCISYFYEFASMSAFMDDCDTDLFMFGTRHAEVFVEGKHALLSNVQMFKALADETRLNMVKLMSQRPWYGHELAQKLNLSNSTVSYHLSALTMSRFVKQDRIDNRIYFRVDMENLKKIICEAVDKMVE